MLLSIAIAVALLAVITEMQCRGKPRATPSSPIAGSSDMHLTENVEAEDTNAAHPNELGSAGRRHESEIVPVVPDRPPTSSDDAELACQGSRRIRGSVMGESGSAIENVRLLATVRLASHAVDQPPGHDCHYLSVSTKNGAFEFIAVAGDRLLLKCSHPSFVEYTDAYDLNGSETVIAPITLTEGLRISGIVRTSAGVPAAGATVTLSAHNSHDQLIERALKMNATLSKSAIADNHGRFAFSGLEAGTFDLHAHLEPSGAGTAPVTVAERGGLMEIAAGHAQIVLDLAPLLAMKGLILDVTGAMPRAVRLRAASADESSDYLAVALRAKPQIDRVVECDSGLFVLDGLAPGDWEVVASVDSKGRSLPVTVTIPAASPYVEFRIRQYGVIAGSVVDSNGVPVRGVLVNVEVPRARVWISEDGQLGQYTDDGGTFRVEGVPAGAATITCSFPRLAASHPLQLQVEPGQLIDNVTITYRQP